jgi:hypothetical protein
MIGFLTFALSPAGRLIGILLVAGGLYTAGFVRGKNRAETRCQTAALRAEVATLKRDRDIARNAAADAATRATAIEAANAADQKIIEEVRRAPSTPSCIATDAAARRVQSIGQGRAGR